MKIQESQGALALHGAEPGMVGAFAGRTMSTGSASASQIPLSALLRRSITLNQVQELALQRLQQGEHTPLSERRIRVL
ncbi:ExsE protein [Aeromonas allosaccharophila]|uniref:T3SS regulon translocated regulator ExsE family protein n=1 Tax=Aeromonas allosaccharophila TaxID=656 RepID=UPI0007182806|nr:T3SS regulon translocated regulator ExsE family protein [Aeromonas allosaccharophila]KRW58386.1 ExsE protein [Aeromonas allosaccharophila]MBS4697305.1 T3SS regulon translocated regulator ExsE family protein [Aeromonas allosaccharophila]MEB8287104.1 T3SS regulon translocated regulator ExsE family protein [Aeromonas veronii]